MKKKKMMMHGRLVVLTLIILAALASRGVSNHLRARHLATEERMLADIRWGHRTASSHVLGLDNPKHLSSAITARYPMRIFNGPTNQTSTNLRNAASFSQSLVDSTTAEKSWTSVARARDHKDVWLYENWFFGMENGVILESGIIETVATSATYLFETLAKWTAIHVEADPDRFLDIGNYRTNSINVHGAFCKESRVLHFSSAGILPARGFVEYMSPEFLKKYHNKIFHNVTHVVDLPTTLCIAPKSFLQLINFYIIDIWILADEGDVESVLLGADFNKVTFNAIVFQCDSTNNDNDQRLIKIVESHGFKCQVVFPNCMCKNNKYIPKTAPVSLMSPTKFSGNDVHKKIHHVHRDDNSKLMSAVTIRYPYSIFKDCNSNWRSRQIIVDKRKETEIGDAKAGIRRWNQDYVYSFSQDDEDVYLYENFFFGVENGVIIESGALDGKEFSNSAMFETYLNWTAIHIEADPDNYAKLLNNRPNAININAALCSEPRVLHWSSYGSVDATKGFVEFMPLDFLKRWHRTVFNNDSMVSTLPAVQCMTVKKLMYELNVKRVDIWILDVEGSEESVLAGVDFNEVQFNSILMECDGIDPVKDSRKMDYIRAKGFVCQLVFRNCMCQNKLYTRSFISPSSPYHIGKGNKQYWDENKWD